jgi:DNA-binding transcriptional ArsR family regulator
MTAGAIGEALDLPPATLSFHLAGLTRAGIARNRQAGRFVIYSADYESMNRLVGFLTENCCGGTACHPSNQGDTHEALARTRRGA